MKYTIAEGFAGDELAQLRKENAELKVRNGELAGQVASLYRRLQ